MIYTKNLEILPFHNLKNRLSDMNEIICFIANAVCISDVVPRYALYGLGISVLTTNVVHIYSVVNFFISPDTLVYAEL